MNDRNSEARRGFEKLFGPLLKKGFTGVDVKNQLSGGKKLKLRVKSLEELMNGNSFTSEGNKVGGGGAKKWDDRKINQKGEMGSKPNNRTNPRKTSINPNAVKNSDTSRTEGDKSGSEEPRRSKRVKIQKEDDFKENGVKGKDEMEEIYSRYFNCRCGDPSNYPCVECVLERWKGEYKFLHPDKDLDDDDIVIEQIIERAVVDVREKKKEEHKSENGKSESEMTDDLNNANETKSENRDSDVPVKGNNDSNTNNTKNTEDLNVNDTADNHTSEPQIGEQLDDKTPDDNMEEDEVNDEDDMNPAANESLEEKSEEDPAAIMAQVDWGKVFQFAGIVMGIKNNA